MEKVLKLKRIYAKYEPEVAERLLKTIESSTEGLSAICKMDEEFPAVGTIYYWKSRHPEFLEGFMRAKLKQTEHMGLAAEDIIEQALDNPRVILDRGGERIDPAFVTLIQMKLDVVKWKAERLFPGTFCKDAKAHLDEKVTGPLVIHLAIPKDEKGE